MHKHCHGHPGRQGCTQHGSCLTRLKSPKTKFQLFSTPTPCACPLKLSKLRFHHTTCNKRLNCQHLLDHRESKRIPEKYLLLASLTMLKPLTVWIMTNSEKFLKRWEQQTTLSASCETCKQHLELDMEQQTGSKLGKEYGKVVYCHSAYLTYMQSTLCKMPGWMITSWKQDCQEKY